MKLFNYYILALTLLVGNPSQSKESRDLIQSATIEKNILNVKINKKFKEKYLKSDFFVRYQEDINLEELPYDIVLSSLITNIISIIWISGDTYYIDTMDEDLYYSLKMLKRVFKAAYPKTSWNGELIARKLVPLPNKWKQPNTKKALLFSGGLDSTSSSFQHKNEDLIFITAWGQYDNPLDREDLWLERTSHIKKLARSHGHSCAFLKSNYSEFFNWDLLNNLSPEIDSWRVNTVEGIGWAGLTAPILMSKNCSTLYIASSTCWYYPYFGADNPYFDGCMRFGNFSIAHDQFEFTRGDKCLFISDLIKKESLKKPFIKVCQGTIDESDTNCCDCEKCLSTILGFVAAGDNHQDYGFNVSIKKAVKRTVKLLKTRISQWFLWTFMDLQVILRNKVNDQATRKLLKPFLAMNLKRAKRITQNKGSWEDLAKVGPQVPVPSYLDREKMAIILR